MTARDATAVLHGRTTESAALDHLLAEARAGRSRVILLRGEAGIGKSALLGYVESSAAGCRIARCAGIESEMEMAYGGLHQLCAPFLDRVERLPEPQAEALQAAFGLSVGQAPDRFLVGLAVLNLLADLAEDEPLLCLVDDAHWLDRVSAQTIAFVARRLLAERIAIVISMREPSDTEDFADLPELMIGGLNAADSGALLDSVLPGPLDPRVRERIVAETHGNPLALLELPRAWTAAELADGFAQPDRASLAGRIEQGFLRRLQALPADTRKLLLTAAAEPLGDATLLWRAAALLELDVSAASAAEEAGLIEFGARVRFLHPLVRAAAYRMSSAKERQEVHRALAEATDPDVDPDRRAWHRAHTATAPDETIAAELEQSAGRARARGGFAAASALLERAARLTPEPIPRAQRELAAAWAKRNAGALDSALALLAAVEAGPPDAFRTAEVEHLRGQIAFDQRHGSEAALLILGAARHLEPLDVPLARETYLDALAAALWGSGAGASGVLVEVAKAARAAPPPRDPPRTIDVVLDALATRLTEGYTAAAPLLTRSLDELCGLDFTAANVGRLLGLGGNRVSSIIATEVWNFESGRTLSARQVQLARDSGALVQLQFSLNVFATSEVLAGDLASAAALLEENRLVAQSTGIPPVAYTAMLLAAFRGQEDAAATLIAGAKEEASTLGEGRIVTFADYASAVLHNGFGRHDIARDEALHVFERDVVGGYQVLAVSELAEAASRTGDAALLSRALARLSERAQVTPTDWLLGIEARAGALLDDGDAADELYRRSIDHLDAAGVRVEAARGYLLYGEWLRRRGQRVAAREQLRIAHDRLTAMGLEAFAERTRRELVATGEKVRKRTVDSSEKLTAQEFQIARLARDGLSNPEIGTQLFLSPRTVEWHLRKVFSKLGVSSRRQLRDAELDMAAA
jgi:DNA-binding CsgD family transcriptional regulator